MLNYLRNANDHVDDPQGSLKTIAQILPKKEEQTPLDERAREVRADMQEEVEVKKIDHLLPRKRQSTK